MNMRLNLHTAVLAVLLAWPLQAWARDTIEIGLPIEPPGFDPTRSPSESIGMVTYGNIYEGLTRLDHTGTVRPLLAREWHVSADGHEYGFVLRPNVHFHDGTPLTCDAVRFSLLRAGLPDSTNPDKALFSNIADIRCPDPLHADILLKAPHGSFIYELAWNDAAIFSPASVTDNASHPVGSGPFMFAQWQRGDHITLRRNPAYWGPTPYLSQATFRFLSDPLAASNALLMGELDAYPSFPAREMISRFRGAPHLRVVRGSFPFKAILALNNRHHPFDDIRVRQALAFAIDRKALVEAMNDGDGTVLQSHMAPNDPDYVPLPDPYPYDPEKAKALLRQAGVKPGTRLILSFPPIGYARDTSELIAAYLEQVGLIVTFQPLEWASWLDRVIGHSAFEMTVIAHTEPHDIGLYDRTSNYFHYDSPAFHALFAAYEATADATVRHELSIQMQRQLARDEPNVFLYSVPRQTVENTDLLGLWTDQPLAACPLAEVRWAR